MKIVYAFVLSFLLSNTAMAQAIGVQSGEHEGFTRLVLQIGKDHGWDINHDRNENTFEVVINRENVKFDLSRVFEKIGNNRILSVENSEGSGGMMVEMACDCEPQAFIYKDVYLVVDVGPSTKPQVTGSPELDEIDTADAQIDPQELPEPEVRETILDSSRVLPLLTGRASRVFPNNTNIGLDESAAVDRGAGNSRSSEVSHLTTQIATDLAAAASKGLLNPSVNRTADALSDIEGISNRQRENRSGNAQESMEPERDTSVSFATDDMGRVQVGGSDCISDERLNLGAWGGDVKDVSEGISKSRNEMVGEFDEIDLAALSNHVRSLIYIGFGAEARQAMTLAPQMENRLLWALSYLVDLEDDPTDFFADQLMCDTASALWSAMDSMQSSNQPAPNPEVVLRAFEMLPKHLREHLGPRLAEQLTHFGDTETARDVLRRLQRATGAETESIAFERARINVVEGNFDAAENTLHELATKPGPEALEALKEVVALADREQVAVPEEYVELLAAYSTEHRNAEDGSELWEKYVLALISTQDLEGAITALSESQDTDSQAYERIKLRILGEIIDSPKDSVFLKLIFDIDMDGVGPVYLEKKIEASERFVELGLPEIGFKILDKVPTNFNFREVQILKSRALLEMGRPEEAEVILIGRQGKDVDALRAEARRQMGDHEFAHQVFRRNGDTNLAEEAAWLSGDWTTLSEASNELMISVAEMVNEEQVRIDPVDVSLKDAEDLSEQSSNTLRTIRDLLKETSLRSE
ncbi:MAG: hypothetical protein N4A61_02050 [Pelagimonas sp.]|jgi:tetratricopeptide (TPR) repeat protein|nr:hypothetical protein [Pelagimonas sp.]